METLSNTEPDSSIIPPPTNNASLMDDFFKPRFRLLKHEIEGDCIERTLKFIM